MANLQSITIGSNTYSVSAYVPSIGEIIIRADNTNPASLYPGTTWTKIAEGQTLIGADNSDFVLGETGGSKDAVVVAHSHTVNSHYHTIAHIHSGDINGVPWYYLMSKNGSSASSAQQAQGSTGNYSPIENAAGMYNKKETVGGQNPTNSGNASPGTNSVGSSGTNANLPPYLVVNIWRRTA